MHRKLLRNGAKMRTDGADPGWAGGKMWKMSKNGQVIEGDFYDIVFRTNEIRDDFCSGISMCRFVSHWGRFAFRNTRKFSRRRSYQKLYRISVEWNILLFFNCLAFFLFFKYFVLFPTILYFLLKIG